MAKATSNPFGESSNIESNHEEESKDVVHPISSSKSSVANINMKRFGTLMKQSFMEKTNKKSIMKSMSSLGNVKKFYDHLALRNSANRAYQKISAVLRQNNQPVESNMVFSDYMYKYNVSLGKEQVIVLINE